MPEKNVAIGDRVSFRLATRQVQGIVKEDRGPIGINRRHLYLVEFRQGPHAEYVSEIELPAAELEPAGSASHS